MKHLLKAALLASATVLASAPIASALDVIISNDNNGVGVKGKTFDLLAEEIKKRLPDADIEVHHSGALFDQKTQIQGLQLGSAHIISPTSGIYAPHAPGVSALTLPFLLSSPEQIVEAMNDEVVRSAFVPDLEKKNIVPVAVWMNGPRELSYKGSKPILTPADMAGVKIRVQSVPSDIAAMKAAGANAVAMSWSEVPTSLQQGVIDGQENPLSVIVSVKLNEVQKYLTLSGHVYSPAMLLVSKPFWDGLDDDQKAAMEKAATEAAAAMRGYVDNVETSGVETLKERGMEVNALSAEEKAAFQASIKSAYEGYYDTYGQELVDSIVNFE